MDDQEFGRLTRSLTGGGMRRRLLIALAGAGLAMLGGGRARAQDERNYDVDASGRFCGGIAAIPCPPGYACIDDPADACEPAGGGADCGGVCHRVGDVGACALIRCASDTRCCPNCDGYCLTWDIPCSDDYCGGERCDPNICGPGEYCCNYSCGVCAPIGQGCPKVSCG